MAVGPPWFATVVGETGPAELQKHSKGLVVERSGTRASTVANGAARSIARGRSERSAEPARLLLGAGRCPRSGSDGQLDHSGRRGALQSHVLRRSR